MTRDARPWGSFEILAHLDRSKIKHIVVKPGAQISYQMHSKRSEVWVFLRGCAEVCINGVWLTYGERETVFIPERSKHRIRNPGPDLLEFIEVQIGDSFEEEDIVRFEDDYNRI